MTSAAQKLSGFLKKILDPADPRTVTQWAEDEVVLTVRTQSPGPFSMGRIPYFRKPLDDFGRIYIKRITIVAGTQTGKTTTITIGVCYRIKNNALDILWVMPSEDLAQSFSETRFQPTLAGIACLQEEMPEDKNKFKNLEMQFAKCVLNFVGSNSPADLSSRPTGIVVLDETDKLSHGNKKEASAVFLSENRVKSFDDPLIVKTSTPTVPEGEIWTAFLEGNQQYLHIECPNCKQLIRLLWDQVKWDQEARSPEGEWDKSKVKESAHYVCQKCGGKMNDADKISAVSKVTDENWIAANPKAAKGDVSYHVSSLYSLQNSCTFGELALQFLRSKKALTGLRDFINSYLAEPFIEDERNSTPSEAKVGDYNLGDEWPDEFRRSLVADVQQQHFWATIRSFSKSGDSRLVWAEKVETYNDIRSVQTRLGVKDEHVFLDCAYDPQRVFAECCKYGWQCFLGSDSPWFETEVGGRKTKQVYARGTDGIPGIGTSAMKYRRVKVWRWSSPSVQDMLATLKRGEDTTISWTIARDTSDEYRKQISNKIKREKINPVTGKKKWEWLNIGKKNDHFWDCESMQVVVACLSGILKSHPEPAKPEGDVDTPP